MAIVSRGHPDPARLRADLERWLRRQPGWERSSILALEEASRANGFSNATYRLELQPASGPVQACILRTPPVEAGLFPHYDLGRQYAFMAALQPAPGVAMAGCRWLEADASAIGQPFFITDFVPGSVAPDQPNYVKAGWIAEATPAQRQVLWRTSLDQLIALARTPPPPELLAAYDWPDRGRSRLAQHIAHWSAIGRWGREQLAVDDGDAWLGELESWLLRHAPVEDPVGLVWGDARFGNVIYRDFEPVALLDWELAAIGDPMIDLAYLLFHVFLTELYHGDDTTPQRFEGFGDDAGSLAYYCTATGSDPARYGYYWAFNAYRILCVWQCKAALMHRAGEWTLEQALEARRGARLLPHLQAVMAGGTPAACARRRVTGASMSC